MGKEIKQSRSDEYNTIYNIIFAAQVGLVRNNVHTHIHASPEFLLLIEETNGNCAIYAVFCEAKTRTKITLRILMVGSCQTSKNLCVKMLERHIVCRTSTEILSGTNSFIKQQHLI